jgi:hypothetical protein
MGMMAAQPGSPAFVNIFQRPTTTIIKKMPPQIQLKALEKIAAIMPASSFCRKANARTKVFVM